MTTGRSCFWKYIFWCQAILKYLMIRAPFYSIYGNIKQRIITPFLHQVKNCYYILYPILGCELWNMVHTVWQYTSPGKVSLMNNNKLNRQFLKD